MKPRGWGVETSFIESGIPRTKDQRGTRRLKAR